MLLVLYLSFFLGRSVWERKIELLMYTLIGALFPDIDTKSKIQRVMYIIFFTLLLLLAYTKQYAAATATGILACLPLNGASPGHFSFDILFNILGRIAILCTKFYYPAYTIIMVYNVIFFLAGVFSHLFADEKTFLIYNFFS